MCFTLLVICLFKQDLNRPKISKYFVINSRHQASKNIEHIFILISDFLKLNKDIKIYVTHVGELSENLKTKNSLSKILFLLAT